MSSLTPSAPSHLRRTLRPAPQAVNDERYQAGISGCGGGASSGIDAMGRRPPGLPGVMGRGTVPCRIHGQRPVLRVATVPGPSETLVPCPAHLPTTCADADGEAEACRSPVSRTSGSASACPSTVPPFRSGTQARHYPAETAPTCRCARPDRFRSPPGFRSFDDSAAQ